MPIVSWQVHPDQPICVEMRLNSPLLVDAEIYVRPPDAAKWQRVWKSEFAEEVPAGRILVTLDPLPPGARLLLAVFFFGARKTQYRAEFRVEQPDAGLPAADLPPISGTTGNRNAAAVEQEVELT